MLSFEADMPNKKKKRSRSLTMKLFLSYVPFTSVILLALLAILEVEIYIEKRGALRDRVNQMVSLESVSLSIPVLKRDNLHVYRKLLRMKSIEGFRGARVKDTDGAVIGSIGDLGKEDAAADLRQIRPLVVSGETVGSLEVIFDSNSILGELVDAAIINLMVLLVVATTLTIVTLLATKRIVVRPIQRLQQSIEKLGNGEDWTPVEWNSNDDIGRVVAAYNDLQRKQLDAEAEAQDRESLLEEMVRQRTDDIKRKEEQLSVAINSIPDAIFMIDQDLNLEIFNENFVTFYDLPKGLAKVGGPLADVIRLRAERGELGEGDVESVVADRLRSYSENPEFKYENVIISSGRILSAHRAPTHSGGWVALVSDITERRKREQELDRVFGLLTESLNYASRIQRSLLPDPALLESFLPESFVVWEPKDIVGGDMVWLRILHDGCLLVIGDCTGHGAPGAFMTMLSTGALDQAVADHPDGDPAQVLQAMHRSIQSALSQDRTEGLSNDGLECAVCRIQSLSGVVDFASARLSLYHATGDRVERLRGDKTAIGYRDVVAVPEFTTHRIVPNKDSRFFVSSDGLIDQIGGQPRRSFGGQRLVSLIQEMGERPIAEQGGLILQGLQSYQGDEPRRDDVTVVGFRPLIE